MTTQSQQITAFTSVKQIYIGEQAHKQIGHYCAELGIVGKVMLVTDAVLYQLGLHNSLVQCLRDAGIEVVKFHQVTADPTEAIVLAAVEQAKVQQVSGIIGFGGGSSMDVAKMVALLGHQGSSDRIPDCYGVNMTQGSRLPLLQIPTTAGTGSEVTPVAIITTGDTTKNACVSPTLMADIVILDASFTENLPASVAAATGVDAMVHALEAYTSKLKKNSLSDGLAKQALQLLNQHILDACDSKHSLNVKQFAKARESMLIGAMLAGQAFANAPVGAVHALAYPLGGHFHIPHGNSNALVLVEVMKFNLPAASREYAQIADLLLPALASDLSDQQKSERLIAHLDSLLNQLNIPRQLREYGVETKHLDTLAQDAMQQTRLLQNNPREVGYPDALAIYTAIL